MLRQTSGHNCVYRDLLDSGHAQQETVQPGGARGHPADAAPALADHRVARLGRRHALLVHAEADDRHLARMHLLDDRPTTDEEGFVQLDVRAESASERVDVIGAGQLVAVEWEPGPESGSAGSWYSQRSPTGV